MRINAFEDNVIALLSTKSDGDMRLTGHEQYDGEAYARRGTFLRQYEIDPDSVLSAELMHGNHGRIVDNLARGKNIRVPKVDILVTTQKNVPLSVSVADCFPVYLHDPVRGAIGLLHAGWKGVSVSEDGETVISSAINLMKCADCDPKNIVAHVGPGIQECCFEVGKSVYDKFKGFSHVRNIPVPIPGVDPDSEITHEYVKKYYVDLRSAIEFHLRHAGLQEYNISSDRKCTRCYKGLTKLNPLPEKSVIEYQFFSARRDKTTPIQSQMAVIVCR